MNIVKQQIVDILNMESVLNKYGVKVLRSKMFSCAFHKDKNPSAKCYDKNFHCFSCGKGRRFNTICSILV